MRRPAPVHNLRENHKVWSPPCVVFLDTETAAEADGTAEVLRLSLWAALRVDRRNARKTQPGEAWGAGGTAAELATWLHEMTRGRDTVWCYAHNLNFDLCTTALPQTMTALGWTVGDFSVRSKAPWLRLRRPGHVLTVVDSWSLFERSLGDLAALHGEDKLPLPDDVADRDGLSARCRDDVRILARAVLSVLDWWDAERLGRWTVSGAASGWNAMRHVPTSRRTVIDPAPDGVAWDRLAVRGGRREVTHVGELIGGPYCEVDLISAYPTVARELPLPYLRIGRDLVAPPGGWPDGSTDPRRETVFYDGLPVDDRRVRSEFWGLIAECEIETDRPRFPCKVDGVTWYPVGRFRTVLAGPELRWAAEIGCLRSIGRAAQYGLGYAMQPWARWVLDQAANKSGTVPTEAQVLCKRWGRSVIGKWAGHGQERMMLGPAPTWGWGYEDGIDGGTGTAGAMVDMAGQRWWVTYDTEPDNAFPAVLAWVESEVRVRIGRVIDWLGSGMWVQVDTDGLVLDLTRAARLVGRRVSLRGRPKDALGVAQAVCDLLQPLVAPLELRPKRLYAGGRVLGPQHIQLDAERRYSGVRRDAKEPQPGMFVARDWPKLQWQMTHGTPGEYRRPVRTVRVEGPKAHGWVTEDGMVLPVACRITQPGDTELIPWSEDARSGGPIRLADAQYARLGRLT